MNFFQLVGSTALLSMAVACTAQAEPSGTQGEQRSPVSAQPAAPVQPGQPDAGPAPAPTPGCTALPKSNGSANPASVYCAALGYQLEGEQCAFPDATSCEQWSFYRGECGQTHSFCNLHGGTVTNKTEDMGTWTASYALCTLPTGKQCQDDTFAQTCACE